jgi:hypothetical protein
MGLLCRLFQCTLNNAQRRYPSSLLLEWEGIPPFAITVIDLQADYQTRTLLIGQQLLRVGNSEKTKRRLSSLVDSLLAEFHIELDEPLPRPVSYVGRGT